MKTSYKCILILLISALFSCSLTNEEYGTPTDNYSVEYSLRTTNAKINKIVYTDISGEVTIDKDIKDNWRIKTFGQSGQTIRFEVSGEKNGSIELHLYARKGIDVIERTLVKECKSDKFHYHIFHILE